MNVEPGPNLTTIIVTLLGLLGSWLGFRKGQSAWRAYRDSKRPPDGGSDDV